MSRDRARRAFTLTELLALLVIVVLLAATFVPYAMSLRETANRTTCAKNLAEIYWALSIYAKQNGYPYYPRTRFDPALGNRWTAFTGADDADPFAVTSAVERNDVTASAWLLVRGGLIKPSSFVCPSSSGAVDAIDDPAGRSVDVARRGNFRSPKGLTYALASPFSAIPDYQWVDTLPSSFVLFADQGRSAASLMKGPIPPFDAPRARLGAINSVNHRGGGQNVLYASGQVIFESSPYCGVGRTRENKDDLRSPERLDGDNIYTALAPTPLVNSSPSHDGPGVAGTSIGPAYQYDTYLVPGAGFVAPTMVRPTPPLIAAAAAPTPTPAPASAPTTATTTAPTTRAK